MNFASFPYLAFLLLSILVYFSLGKSLRNIFLLLTSYLFYAFFGFGFVALMIFTTLVTFISASLCYKAKSKNAQGFTENKDAAQRGGNIAGDARKKLEQETDEKVVTPENYIEQPEHVKRLAHKKK